MLLYSKKLNKNLHLSNHNLSSTKTNRLLQEEGYGAAGNIATNVGRTITVALAIGATIYFKRKRGEKCLDYKKI